MLQVPDPFPSANVLHLTLVATPETVRETLRQIMAAPPVNRLASDHRATVEIVLAEALNNIVEHAYPSAPGSVSLTLVATARGLECQLVDHGAPMPDATLPAGQLPTFDPATLETLPEGGFGWYLLRSLTSALTYQRKAGANHLRFTVPERKGSTRL